MARLEIDSKNIDPIQLRVYEAIQRVALHQKVPFIIVGASARDLVMHQAYGAPIQRATMDIDLAVQVPDWAVFERIRDSLMFYEQHEAVLEAHDWDTRLAGAHVLGMAIANIASESTLAFLKRSLDEDLVANLVREARNACGNATTDIVSALVGGLFGTG